MAIAQFFSHRHLQLHLLNLNARQRLLLAVAVGGITWLLLPGTLLPTTRLVAAWDVFCLSSLALIWAGTRNADTAHIRRMATRQDPGRTWAFIAVLVASSASLMAVVALLSGLAKMRGSEVTVHVLLSIGAVVGAWLQLHAVFALRYAHQYYSENLATVPPDNLGGLDFPGGPPANYWDFAYFAFVVGMTAQTADVAISSTHMRQLVMLHGLLAFAFNTSVVALTINLVAGLL
ncbi:DUF1345 domain-containing protein [Hymenobacter sp. DH14]|uniref:DUF1345 domain-containing protein n=1 Tax=Hymenobacter cyanobacteriorum TaxID=2926463 RepID=A0A9X1VMH2_9BACT|nr:DUF1345 domain-containing protein [Hymenobacter cyanobacteriorum]MCI1189770.1 DUF1345 domain-containing protein [Hymenobacter cyanobacteriorum]